jgi:hypothetical protein
MRGRVRQVKNTNDRVGIIIGLIKKGKKSRYVHSFASMALTDFSGNDWAIQPRDWLGEVHALADFIQSNVRYTLDPFGIDTYSTPERTIQMAKGDCDDMVILSGAMLQSVGYPIKIKVIRLEGQPEFHHIYMLVGLPPERVQKWIAFDPSQPESCGAEPPGIAQYRIFDM